MLATKWILQKVFKRTINKIGREKRFDSPLLESVNKELFLEPEKLLRLGTQYGGWIIPIDSGLSPDSICYSAGAGEDISFDCALVEGFHCNVRIIDPTPRAIAHFENLKKAVFAGERFPINNSDTEFYTVTAADIERLILIPAGLANRDAKLKFFYPKNPIHVSCSILNLQKTEEFFVAQCYRLTSLMRQMKDTSIDLLKIDIEGGEYGVIEDVVGSNTLPKMLLVEFDEAHTPLDEKAAHRIKTHLEMLAEAGMKCVAVEGSNATFIRERF